MSLEYFAPSREAPAITPFCPNTIAYIGFVKVLFVKPSDPPFFQKKTSASAPISQPSVMRNVFKASSVMKKITWLYCKAPI